MQRPGKSWQTHLIDTLKISKVLVFLDSDSSHSQSLEKAFEDKFGAINVELANLADPDLDLENRVQGRFGQSNSSRPAFSQY